MTLDSRPALYALSLPVIFSILITLISCAGDKDFDEELSAYLFTYFVGNGPGEESIHFAVSLDGYNYRALNGNGPVVDSKAISSSGGVRDPHILRGIDGKTFYMVATDLYVPKQQWSNYAIILMKSTDLINWETSVVNIPKTFPTEFGDVHRVWAPQTIYDETANKYMIYFSMKQADNPDIIYYAYANADFNGLEGPPSQLYFPPAESNTKACIDADIIYLDGKYHLFHKAEDGQPGIKLAISDKLTNGYRLSSDKRVDLETRPVEGSGIFKLISTNEWVLMYDVYTSGSYQFTKSRDLRNFSVIDKGISMNFHPRHGTVMQITKDELKRLISKWGRFDDLLVEATSPKVKGLNVVFDGDAKTIHLPVKRGIDVTDLDPQFKCYPNISVKPTGSQNFVDRQVAYTFTIEGQGDMVYNVRASEHHNPALEGYYADPEVLYTEKTGKYYIYPTTDGFLEWEGDYFKVFSSDDLLDWKDEGIILDLKKDVSWADRNAWAPCIIERKIDDTYKYFYYFTAEKKIGVATSDDPAGPFKDIGKPLIDKLPDGVARGQEIDPDVFSDPKTGTHYFYWGNTYLAVAQLNDDMVSFKPNSTKILIPDAKYYGEGAHVFYRNGKYYFSWSAWDTRSPDYQVRYVTSDSPTGPIDPSKFKVLIQKDTVKEIYATGHHSVVQVPGKDEWYIVYHRFVYPKGIKMGRSAGYHREVCIDKLEFDKDGNIMEVKPTLKGLPF